MIIEYPVWVSLNALTPILFSLKKKIEKSTRTYRLFYHSEIRRELQHARMNESKRVGQYVLPPIVDIWFQVLFHSPPGVLFTLPPQYRDWETDRKSVV